MTFKESPKPAIMNANSPICAKENPDCIAILSGFKSYNSFYKTYLKFYGEKPSLKSKKIQEKLYWPFESANQPFLNQ